MKDIEFDINISDSQSSPVHRQIANQFLMEIWKAGQISLNALLEAGQFPYGEKLKAIIAAEQQKAQEQAAQQQQMAMEQQPPTE